MSTASLKTWRANGPGATGTGQARSPRPAGAPPRPGLSRRAVLLLLAALAVPFTVLGLLQADADAPTWDEGIYLSAGTSALVHREVRVNFEHPPLAKVLAAAPALLADPVVPRTDAWREGRQFIYADEFVVANRATGTLDRVVLLGRLVPLAAGVAVAFVLASIAARLFGRWDAGLLAGGLWLTSPFTLGLAHVQTIDVPFTLAALLTVAALLRALRRRATRGEARERRGAALGDAALVGLACGAALLVRNTGLVLLGAVGLALVLDGLRRGLPGRARRDAVLAAAVVGVVAWGCVWVGYRALAPSPAPLPAQSQLDVQTGDAPVEPPAEARLVTVLPWPQEYELGVEYLARVSTPPAPASLFGQSWDGGRWWYWPGSMLVKLTPGVLAVLAAGVVGLATRAGWRSVASDRRRELLLGVALPAVVLGVFTMAQPRPLGLRYLLPTLALGLAASGWVVRVSSRRWGRVALGALAVTQALALASAHPHSLAWTAPPFRPAYRYVTDANLDWAQDYDRVAEWARDRRAQGRPVWIAAVGPPGYRVEDYGVRQLVGADPLEVRGDVAVFGSLLTAYKRDDLAWIRGYCSVGTIGGSVVLYRFDQAPDPRPGPEQPAGPCEGDVSVRAEGPRADTDASWAGSVRAD